MLMYQRNGDILFKWSVQKHFRPKKKKLHKSNHRKVIDTYDKENR